MVFRILSQNDYEVLVIPTGFEPVTSRFIPTTTFVAISLRNVCGLDFLFTIPKKIGLGAARQVSTPLPSGTWLGIALQ